MLFCSFDAGLEGPRISAFSFPLWLTSAATSSGSAMRLACRSIVVTSLRIY